MEFLRSKEFRVKKYYPNCEKEQRLFTSYDMEQKLYVELGKEDSPDRIEAIVVFDKNHPAPKKVSLSANQYTMHPFDIKVSLYKKRSRNPYSSFTMGEFRSIFDLVDETTRIVFEFINVDNERRFADVKLIVNYVQF
ncbi:MAG: hypothetical protein IKL68_04150 [Clostridia bacterium]|nr:hypothetical protein [Clostridia bacterium]